MRFFAQLFAAAAVFASVNGQYDDGYENVTTPTTPVQMRVAFQGPTGMMVSWNTFAQLTNPTVMYGTDPNALNQVAVSSVSVTYPTSLTYNNHVNITGLSPNTMYYYQPQFSNSTTPYSFMTARAAGDTTPYTVGVVVDMGTFGALGLSDHIGTGAANPLRTNEQTTITALTQMVDTYEFLVHAGDIAYADYWLKEEGQGYLPNTTVANGYKVYESILNAFFDEMVGLTANKAYMVNCGNHETNCDNSKATGTTGVKYDSSICSLGQTNFTGYINHWRMPSGPSGGLGNMWYSYDYGMTHFVHIDTETDLGNSLAGPDEGSPEYGGPFGTYNQQINWLTNDLASVNRTITPWIVVFGHRGWYLSSSSSVCANCQTAFEKLFYTYGVDLYMNGHAHLYERTVPIYNGVVDPNGVNNPSAPLYITNGAAGHAYHEASDYAWSRINFLNRTHLTVDTLWSSNNSVFDTVTLYKSHVYSTSSSSSTTIILSTSTTSSISATSTTPTTTTNAASTTTSSIYPSYTNFNGQGHLFVYTGGMLEGDIGSAGTWYNAPGQNTATFTAVPLYSNNSAFYIQHGSNYCAIGSDYSFGCVPTSTSGATVFGQTSDGNLTYLGSPAFFAQSSASVSSRPTVYATSLPVSLNIVWGGTATTTTTSATTTSSMSGTATTTSGSTTGTSTSSVASTSISSNSSSTIPTTSSTLSSNSSSIASTTGISSCAVMTTTAFATTTATSITTTTSVSTSISSVTAYSTITVTNTITSASPTTTTTTITDSTTETDTATTTSTESDTITLPASTVTQTETETMTQTSTETDTVTLPASTVTQTETSTMTQTSTETDTTTLPASTETNTVYVTLPASTVTETSVFTTTQTQPASTSTVTVTATATRTSTTVSTKPASTVTSVSTRTSTVTLPASTQTATVIKTTTMKTTTTIAQTITKTSISRTTAVSTVTKTTTTTKA